MMATAYRRPALPRDPEALRQRIERAELSLDRARRIVAARMRSQGRGQGAFQRELLAEGFSQLEADDLVWAPLPSIRVAERRLESLRRALTRGERRTA